MNDKAKGYLLGVIASASYGMNPLFALPLYQSGMTPDEVLFYRYSLAIPILAVMIIARGRNFKIKKQEAGVLFFMGMVIAISSLTLFSSYNYMSVGIASTLLFVYPIIVALIMIVFFKEKLNLVTTLSMLLALAGIGMLYQNTEEESLSLLGTVLALASALTYALYIIGVNQFKSLQNMATLKVTFYVLLFGFFFYLVRLDFGRALTCPDHWYLWANILGLALFPTAISFLCTTSAVQYIGSTPTAILGALEPVTAVIVGVGVFGETLSVREMSGLVMIIAAVTFVIAGGNITTYMVRFRKLFPRRPFTGKLFGK